MKHFLLPLLLMPILSLGADNLNLSLWEGSDNLLSKLTNIQEILQGDILQFNALKNVLGSFSSLFDDRLKQQDLLYSSILQKFQTLTNNVNILNASKEQLSAQGLLEKRNLESEITAVMLNTTKEINALKDSIGNISTQITELKSNISILNDLNSAQLTSIITQLQAVRSNYLDMVLQRELFLNALNTVLSKLRSYVNSAGTFNENIKTTL